MTLTVLRRQMSLLDFTLYAMRRRAGRNLVLFAVYCLVIVILASVMFFSHAVRQEASTVLKAAPEVTVQRLVMGRHDLVPMSYLDKIRTIRGVQSAEGRLWGYFYDRGTKANYTLMVPGGRAFDFQLDDGQTILGEGIAKLKNAKQGRILALSSPTGKPLVLRIKQILTPDSALVSSDLVLVSESDFRRFFELPDAVYTDLVLNVRNQKEVSTIVGKASYLLPDARFVTRNDILRTYESIFSWREGLLLALLSTSIIAFCILVFDKASGLSGEERREIGILKAVGWDTSDILTMKVWEGALISLLAFFVGCVLAYIHVFWLNAGLLKPVLMGWAVLYPDFSLKPAIDLLQLATLAFFTVVPFSVATLVPIWRAAITDPNR